jgi:opacity protein-like surface antigen
MRETVILAVVLGLALAASPAWAGERRSGPDEKASAITEIYVGLLGTGVWQYNVEDEFQTSAVHTNAQSGHTYGGAVLYGVQYLKYWAIEVEFEWIPGFKFEQTSIFGTYSDKITTSNLSSNVAYRPLDGRFEPFISLGPSWMRVKLDSYGATSNGLALRLGVGADLWLTESLGVRLEGRYTLPVSNRLKNFDLVGPRVGLFYRF